MSDISITRWRSLTEPKGTRHEMSWHELSTMLSTPGPRPLDPSNPDLEGWGPATFKGNHRLKDRIEAVYALGLDHDKGELSLDRMKLLYNGFRALVHNTRRSTPSAPRWRVAVAVSRPITLEEFLVVWTHERDRLAEYGAHIDKQTKDPSRLWYVPCVPAEGEFIFAELEGEPIDVDAAIAKMRARETKVASRKASAPAKLPTSNENDELARISAATRRKRAAAYVTHTEVSVSGENGHKTAMRVVTAVVRGFALDAADAREVLDDWNARCEPPWSSEELDHKIREASRVGALNWGSKLLEGPSPKTQGNAAVRLLPELEEEGVVIRIDVDLHRVVDEGVVALNADDAIYQRDAQLVTVVRVAESESDSMALEGTPQIRTMAAATLRERLSSVAKWKKYDGRAKRWQPVLPDNDVVGAIAARGQWRGVRPLVGVIETPSLRPDGSVIQRSGYDAATGFLLVPANEFPNVPEAPTQDDAKQALSELLEPLIDFPYANESHRSTTLAAILTLIARPAIEGSVPGIVFSASTRGSGKTLQSDVVSLIATGRESAKMGYPSEDDELEKTLGAYALRGAMLVNFDNVTRPFGGGPLDRCLTAGDRVELRVLGRSEVPSLRWRAMIMATGNNVDIAGDTARRVLISQIESPLENPEERTGFKHPDLLLWVRENRTKLVTAALILLRAFIVAGRPNVGTQTWGSFEGWSKLIPPALVWAGAVDPMLSRVTNDASAEPEKAALAVLVASWTRLAGDTGMTAKAALQSLYPHMKDREQGPPDGFDDLRESVEMLTNAQHGRPPSPARLSYVMRRARKRNIGGRHLDCLMTHGGVQRWFVVEPNPRNGGDGGVENSKPVDPHHDPHQSESHCFSDL